MVSAFAVLAMSCFMASEQAAMGLEPGVHIDPGSPAAKEYALPLNQARQTGSSPTTGSPTAAPFGAGIHPPGGSGGGSSNRGSSTGSGASSANTSTASSSNTRTAVPALVLRSTSRQASSGGDGSILALVGGGVAILVLGGFGGMIMQRSQRVTPLA
jgi:hypothetical protein